MLQHIEAIFLDWDDVVIKGAKEGYFTCFQKTLAYLGIDMDWQEALRRIMSKWGGSLTEEFKALLQEQPELVEEAAVYYKRLLRSEMYLAHLSPIPGVQEALRQLSRYYTLCVVSGASRSLIAETIMPRFNIPRVFDLILSSGDFTEPEKQKPNPYMVEFLLDRYCLRPSQAVYVGDAANDVQMAQAAGVIPIVVLTGHLTKQEAQGLGVKFIIPDVTHLKETLEE